MSATIIVESCFPGTASGAQSSWLGNIIANVLNWITGEGEAVIVEPLEVQVAEDSSFLGEKDGKAQIATGTTTLLEFSVKEKTYVKGETTNKEFSYERLVGTAEDYNVLVSSYSDGTYARIVAVGEPSSEDYKIRFYAGSTKDVYCDYTFNIASLVAPTSYTVSLPEEISSNGLAIGESALLDITLTGSRTDDYLRRYWDPSLLTYSSSDETVATVDNSGRILAVGTGSATISVGDKTVPIVVNDEAASIEGELSISQEDGSLAQNDYDVLGDYVTDHSGVSTREAANAISSGVVLEATLGGAAYDVGYSWKVTSSGSSSDTDYLAAKIVPLNESGSRVRLLGYRTSPGETINVLCSAYDSSGNEISARTVVGVEEIVPVSMSLSANRSTISSGINYGGTISLSNYKSKQLTLEGSFVGAGNNTNVTNRNLVVTVPEAHASAFSVSGSGNTSVTLTFLETGTHSLTISSEANPELTYNLSFTIEAPPNVDPTSGSFRTLVRKFLGHGTLFAVTAVFGFLFFEQFFEKKKLWHTASVSAGIGLTLAALSEFIQLFVPDRGGSITDIGIDFLGYAIGTLILWLIFFLIRKHKEKKALKQNDGANSLP